MSSLFNFFASSDNPKSLGFKFRTRRLQEFEKIFFSRFSNGEKIEILDVGGTAYFWQHSSLLSRPGLCITLLNLHLEETSHPAVRALQGDATDMQEFEKGSFDLVFSNSVIEHLHTLEQQQKMASEICRVGKSYFIQTPNAYFPIESHYALPFAQYYPKAFLHFILTKTKLSRLTRWSTAEASQYQDEIRLLNEKEMKALFPGASLLKEKVFGLTKSITAHTLA
ncbi:MAG: methyltransferase domain-containing protein [Bacteroidetes bacterium]|nr:methyltransferase domain-containing protein [Bacteroidota bacterium]